MYKHIIFEFYNTPWAILPEKLHAISRFLETKSLGIESNHSDIASSAHLAPQQRQQGAVSVIPIYGVIGQRMNMFSEFSGGTSTERVSKQIQSAINDPAVGSIVLDIDSPGGSVYGISELASEIYAARSKKPITAVANSLAASAAYWIGSSASEFVVTPGGEVGSIGVITAHTDFSKFEEESGIKTTIISSGKYKSEGNQFEPLSDEARSAIQARVNEYYDMFVRAVAKHRGVGVSEVRNGFGQGRVVGSTEAASTGMVDGISTLDNVIKKMSRGKSARSNKLSLAERI